MTALENFVTFGKQACKLLLHLAHILTNDCYIWHDCLKKTSLHLASMHANYCYICHACWQIISSFGMHAYKLLRGIITR